MQRTNMIRKPLDWQGIALPREDERHVDTATRAYDLPALMRQRDSAPMMSRTRGRRGEGERLMAPAPRLGDGVRHAVTVKLADFAPDGSILECVEVA